jgi:hypothetical protein
MGVAKDTYPHDGDTYSFVAGFAEVEVDVETGKTRLVDYLAVADIGTVVNPRSLHGQILGGINLGIGHALQQKFRLRPALRRRAGAAVLPEQAADDPRHPGRDAHRSARASPIRKHRSARAASVSRQSAPATGR